MTKKSVGNISRRTMVQSTAMMVAAPALISRAAAQTTPRWGGTLRYGLSVEPQRMNQLNTVWMTDATQHLYDRLLTRAPDGSYVPNLATWALSPDNLAWTFKLKPGIKFHSGEPYTSAAVKWWFDQAGDPKGFYGFKGSYSSVDSVETPDELTAVVKLKHPDAALAFILYTVYSSIINPTVYERLGKDAYGVDTVDGTGPFRLKEFTPGSKLIIERNDVYAWAPPCVQNQGPAWLDAIESRYIADDPARTAAVEAGDLDIIIQPNLADVERLQQSRELVVKSKPMPGVRVIFFNTETKPWDDKRVRQAVAHAIEREPIIQKLLFGQGIAAYSLVPPFFKDMYLPDCEKFFPFNLKSAKDLLTAAGLVDHDADGMVEFQGKPWEPELLVTAAADQVALAQVIQAQLARIGIKIKIVQVDLQTLIAHMHNGDFGALTGGYLWDGPDTILDWWLFSGNIPSTNRARVRVRKPRIDSLLEKMRNSATLAERAAVVRDIQRVFQGDIAAIIPIYCPLDIYVISKKVHGYEPNLMTLYPRMNDVWLDA